jgi:hypothetical protein
LAAEFKSEKQFHSENSFIIELLKSQKIGVLGHIIDPKPLWSAIITNFIRKSIDVAISRFENSGITHFAVRLI